MNAVLENIKKRRSVRKYQSTPISENELSLILEAGRYAPSGGNNQTNHLLMIQNADILQKLNQLVKTEFCKMEITDGMYKSIRLSIQSAGKDDYNFLHHAPTLVIVANQKGYTNALADCACVLENMMLAATSLEIASCWINQLHWLDENPVIRHYLEGLGLEESETIGGSLILGYSAVPELKPLPRAGNPVTYII